MSVATSPLKNPLNNPLGTLTRQGTTWEAIKHQHVATENHLLQTLFSILVHLP